jgi:hypothetical protein
MDIKSVPTVEPIIYDAILTDNEAERRLSGVFAVGLVKAPAIQADFVKYAAPTKVVQAAPEERRLTGPLVIPDQLVASGYASDGTPIYTRYSADVIRHMSEQANIRGIGRAVNHEHGKEPGGLYIVESWLIKDPAKDKAAALGMDYPAGTWMVTVAVHNDSYWQEYVETGAVKGFSLEGLIDLKRAVQAAPKRKRSLRQLVYKAVEATVKAIMQADPRNVTQIQNDIMEVFIDMGSERVPLMLDDAGMLPVYDSTGAAIGTLQFVPAEAATEVEQSATPPKDGEAEKDKKMQAAIQSAVEAATKALQSELATLKKAVQSSKQTLPETPEKGPVDKHQSLVEALKVVASIRK